MLPVVGDNVADRVFWSDLRIDYRRIRVAGLSGRVGTASVGAMNRKVRGIVESVRQWLMRVFGWDIGPYSGS